METAAQIIVAIALRIAGLCDALAALGIEVKTAESYDRKGLVIRVSGRFNAVPGEVYEALGARKVSNPFGCWVEIPVDWDDKKAALDVYECLAETARPMESWVAEL
jgi:hypothetical protein